MNIKVHFFFFFFLHTDLDKFPDNFGDVGDKQRERFHQDIKTMEERYQGRWDKQMISGYCWSNKKGIKEHWT